MLHQSLSLDGTNKMGIMDGMERKFGMDGTYGMDGAYGMDRMDKQLVSKFLIGC